MTTVTESIRRYPGIYSDHATNVPLDHVPAPAPNNWLRKAIKAGLVAGAIVAAAIYAPGLIFVAFALYVLWAFVSVIRTGWPV